MISRNIRRRAWWRGEDSNLRRHRQQIYSLSPLAAREPLRIKIIPFLIRSIPPGAERKKTGILTSYISGKKITKKTTLY